MSADARLEMPEMSDRGQMLGGETPRSTRPHQRDSQVHNCWRVIATQRSTQGPRGETGRHWREAWGERCNAPWRTRCEQGRCRWPSGVEHAPRRRRASGRQKLRARWGGRARASCSASRAGPWRRRSGDDVGASVGDGAGDVGVDTEGSGDGSDSACRERVMSVWEQAASETRTDRGLSTRARTPKRDLFPHSPGSEFNLTTRPDSAQHRARRVDRRCTVWTAELAATDTSRHATP